MVDAVFVKEIQRIEPPPMRSCYVFDLDGTLADLSHRLHHVSGEEQDWDAFYAACAEDAPIIPLVLLARQLHKALSPVVIVTGRSDQVYTQTVQWLRENCVYYDALYMRREGDHRPDVVVKREMYDQLRADGYEPLLAFEDRARVVQMWRSLGITCLQVADGTY